MASVRVRFLGSGDAFGSGGRFQTCILIETNGYKCLLDCGASSLIALKGASVKPNDIDTILVTHLHGDHFGGIPFFILDGQFSRRTKPVLVAGPPGTRTRVREAMEVLFPGSSTARRLFEVEIEELVEDVPWAHGPLTVTPFEVVHACGAPPYALRVDLGGKIITYSGDTQWTDRLVAAAAGADLFICEAYFYDKRVPFHLDYETLMQNRSKIDCQRIVVTHSAADLVARLPELELEAAYDGLEIAL
ncbi:MAG TPA: MBL fold metallo-hydrolase [Vicinamibacteria bacterium]|nr:MBL fold metallo-hydrolase [Vicinamibacteria bacterium]